MSCVALLTRAGGGYGGGLHTLTVDARIVIVPSKPSEVDKAPDFPVHLDDEAGPDIGAGWTRNRGRSTEYLALIIDDPAFSRPIQPASTMRATTPRCMPSTGSAPSNAGRVDRVPYLRKYVLPSAAVAALLTLLNGAPAASRDAAPQVVGGRPATAVNLAFQITETARRFALPASWIWAVAAAESAGDVRAVSGAGAMGLMQIMPQTWADLRARYHLGADPFDVHDNIIAGAAYLRELYDRFGSPGFLAAYNAGPARYQDHLTSARPLSPETQRYAAVLGAVVDGFQLRRQAVIAPRHLPWTRAPLFVRSDTDGSAASAPSLETAPAALPSQRSDRGSSRPAPAAAEMFVRRSGEAPS